MAFLAAATVSARPVEAALPTLSYRSSLVATSALVASRTFSRKGDRSILVAQPQRLRPKGPGASLSARCFSALSPELKSTIDTVVQSNKVVLFMKGTKDFPQCGFSHTVVQILKILNVPFETLNILENEILRQAMKEYSSWPTFPQLYIDGEFFGGCDIAVEGYKNGQLQEAIEKAMCS